MNCNRIKQNIDLEVNGSIITNNAEKADIFARNFKDIVNGPLHTINENQEVVINTAKKENMNSNYNDRFKMEELQECIRTLPADKAIGDDDIHNKFLKNLPKTKLVELLRLANTSWRKTKIPQSWKHALIVPIHKPGKDPKEPESYRPISLLSCVGKVVERMVNRRLTWILEKEILKKVL